MGSTQTSELSQDNILDSDLQTLTKLFDTNPSAKAVLTDISTLRLLAEHHGLPYTDSIQQLVNYSLMGDEDLLRIAIEICDIRAITVTLERMSDGEQYCSIAIDSSPSSNTSGYDKYSRALIIAAEYDHQIVVNKIDELDTFECSHTGTYNISNILKKFRAYHTAVTVATANGHSSVAHQIRRLSYAKSNTLMLTAIRIGDMTVVNNMLELGADNYNMAVLEAVKNGNCDIVTQMLDLGADNYCQVMECTAEYENQVMIDMLVDRLQEFVNQKLSLPTSIYIFKLQCYNTTMAAAARKGNITIVNQMLELGACNYNEAAASAAIEGHQYIVNGMLELCVSKYGKGCSNRCDYNRVMIWAAMGGHHPIITQMIELGANDYNTAMAWAAKTGRRNIVNRMLNLGATSYNRTMEYAAKSGHQDIVDHMLRLGANCYSRSLTAAVKGCHIDIVNQMLMLETVSWTNKDECHRMLSNADVRSRKI